MKQTAVEWLFQQLWEKPKDKFTWHSILDQAKAMEKEQIMDAYKADLYPCSDEDAEDYYNQTFKSE
jgi:hypothetical protein